MTYYLFYSFFSDTCGGTVTMKIIDVDYDRENKQFIAHFLSNLSGVPDSFCVDAKTKALLSPFMDDGQIASLKGKCFSIAYDFMSYEQGHEDEFFDWDDDKKIALVIDGVTEVDPESIDF